MESISVHDNIIIGYCVDCERAEICIKTKFSNSGISEHTDIIFRMILAYYFEGDNLNTIISSIDEMSIETILQNHASQFEEGINYDWPGHWNESLEKALEYLKSKGAKAWSISSSYGMVGFIIGQSIEYVAR